MEDKARCDIFIDSVCNDAHGQNAIEAMCFGVPVVNCLGDYYMALYPDTPIINACESTIYSVLKDLVENPQKRKKIGDATRKYCVDNFAVKIRVAMWINLIEFIVETGDNPCA
jgi:glycosyltransferase involved in cell wall biosynthesis